MAIKQISVFLENKKGRLLAVTRLLAENKINLRALSVADTTDFGILRMIVNDTSRAYEILKNAGFTLKITEVIGVDTTDEPGALNEVLEVLEKGSINIEYIYAFCTAQSGHALNVIRVDKMDAVNDILEQNGIKTLAPDEIV